MKLRRRASPKATSRPTRSPRPPSSSPCAAVLGTPAPPRAARPPACAPSACVRAARVATLLLAVLFFVYGRVAWCVDSDEPFRRLITAFVEDVVCGDGGCGGRARGWSEGIQRRLRFARVGAASVDVAAALPVAQLGLVTSVEVFAFLGLVAPMLVCLVVRDRGLRAVAKMVVLVVGVSSAGVTLMPALFMSNARLLSPPDARGGETGLLADLIAWSVAGEAALSTAELRRAVAVDASGVQVPFAGLRGGTVRVPREIVVKEAYMKIMERLWEDHSMAQEEAESRAKANETVVVAAAAAAAAAAPSLRGTGDTDWQNLLNGAVNASGSPGDVVFVTILSLIAGESLSGETPWALDGINPVCALQRSLKCRGFHTGDCPRAETAPCPVYMNLPDGIIRRDVSCGCYSCPTPIGEDAYQSGCLPALIAKVRGSREREYTSFLRSERLLTELFVVAGAIGVASIATIFS